MYLGHPRYSGGGLPFKMTEAMMTTLRRQPVIASNFDTSMGSIDMCFSMPTSRQKRGIFGFIRSRAPSSSGVDIATNPSLEFVIKTAQCIHDVVELDGGTIKRLTKFRRIFEGAEIGCPGGQNCPLLVMG